MKEIIFQFKNLLTLFLAGSIIILFNNCQDTYEEDMELQDSVAIEESIPWNELLNQLDLDSDMLFIQQGESIQDAIDAALPGNTIYIEPGNYPEKISLGRSDVNVIGLSFEPDDLTIDNGIEKSIEKIDLYKAGNSKSSDSNTSKSFKHKRRSTIHNFSRTELGRGIAHYQFEVIMGSGEYDKVRIHRVVRESRPNKPVPTKGDVFMVHGAIQDFDDIFLTAGAETINAKTSSPFYLASKNIDVWGIDMGWTMVPLETTDFSFMQGWGMEKDIDHALKAMSIARLIRGLSRQGFSRMNVLGFSYGADVAYGAAGRETQQHRFWRDVKGIVHVDRALKLNRPEFPNFQPYWCNEASTMNDAINNGKYHDPWGVGFLTWGDLALTTPDGDSPFHPTFSNSEFLRFVGSQGFFAGDKDGFIYSDPLRFFRLAANLSPHWPLQVKHDMAACCCDEVDVSYEEHFDKIAVPILFIGSELGGGLLASYTSGYTASTDITDFIVPGYSHADLWFGYEADQQVWSPLRQWLTIHK